MGVKEQILNRKSQITKKLDRIRELNGPDTDVERLWKLLDGAEMKSNEMMDLYDDWIDEAEVEAKTKAINIEKAKAVDEYATKITEVAALLIARAQQTLTRNTSRHEDRPHFKPVSDMRPPMLSTESEPHEMRLWINKLRAYCKASHVERLDLDGQKSLFKNFLGADLGALIETDLDEALSIEACYLVVENHFLTIKPLFSRRLALFKIKKEHRPFKEFVADIRRQAREAELSAITPSQLLVFLALAGTREETMIFSLLRGLRDPDMNDLLEKAAEHEGVLKDVAVISGSTAPIMAVESEEEILAAVAASCGGCGRPHARAVCPFRDRPCFACGKVGHIKHLCRQRSPSGERERGRTRDRDHRGSPRIKYDGESSRSPSSVRFRTVMRGDMAMTMVNVKCVDQNGCDFTMSCLPDSGAARTVLPMKACPKGTVLSPSRTTLSAANGTALRNAGRFDFDCHAQGGPSARISAVVSPDLVEFPLIGRRDLKALGILTEDFPAVHKCGKAAINLVHEGRDNKSKVTTPTQEQVEEIERAVSRIGKACYDCAFNSTPLRKASIRFM